MRASFRAAVGPIAVAVIMVAGGCQQVGGPGSPVDSPVAPGSGAPSGSSSPSTTATLVPPRPTEEDLLVRRTRRPVSAVSATAALEGVPGDVVIDPVVGEVYVTTCRGCGQEPSGLAESSDQLAVFDSATAQPAGEIPLDTRLPGMYPRVVADPYAGVLYASRTGQAGGSITMIDTAR